MNGRCCMPVKSWAELVGSMLFSGFWASWGQLVPRRFEVMPNPAVGPLRARALARHSADAAPVKGAARQPTRDNGRKGPAKGHLPPPKEKKDVKTAIGAARARAACSACSDAGKFLAQPAVESLRVDVRRKLPSR